MKAVQGLPIETRRDILQREITNYTQHGYRVVSQTDTTAQLVKPKSFSIIIAAVLLLCMVLPFVLYLLWYAASTEAQVYVVVDEDGRVSRRH